MATHEQRKNPRVDSLNLSYVCIDENDNILMEGMGRTLNVSESGILLETHFSILPGQNISLTLAIGEELLDIEGQVVRSTQSENSSYQTGIEFARLDLKNFSVLKKFIRLFQEQEE
ncbi:MAG: PilZ domain-containing protein [Desulfococcaceae bacterium]|jgi:hypothetical protein|nr:PilZ domain-containing protein [Desulfococcaceae bacterium]